MPDDTASTNYDAVLLISFGGPEKADDVIPFLENVLRGKNVPRERMLAVAGHYYHFKGKSPINQQCRDLIAALQPEIGLPIYWGNRNWHPMLADTIQKMRDDGIRHALALATSAFGSYSGCRQYTEDIETARAAITTPPLIDKLPPFWNRPGFIEAIVDRVHGALVELPGAEVVYTAHSIPVSMADASPYEQQLRAAARLVNAQLRLGEPILAFQSRSGPPSQAWLEPDIGDHIRQTEAKKLIAVPLGFLSDHMEVLYDLDFEAAEIAKERGIQFLRAGTAGTHPRFISGLAALIGDTLVNGFTSCSPGCCRPAALRPDLCAGPAAVADAPCSERSSSDLPHSDSSGT